MEQRTTHRCSSNQAAIRIIGLRNSQHLPKLTTSHLDPSNFYSERTPMIDEVIIPNSLPWSSDSDLPYARKPRIEGTGRHIAVFGNAQVELQDVWEEEALYAAHAANHYPKLIETLKEIRAEFRVETMDGYKYAGVGHDSDALPRIVARLDATLQAAGVKI